MDPESENDSWDFNAGWEDSTASKTTHIPEMSIPEAQPRVPEEKAESMRHPETLPFTTAESPERGLQQAVAPLKSLKYDKAVMVSNPEIKGTLKRFHVFRVAIEGAHIQQDQPVRHRYSDFVWLRTVLVNAYCGCVVPPLPPKKSYGNTEENFLRSRMRDLERFLNRVVESVCLKDDEAVKVFFQNEGPVFDRMKKDIEASIAGLNLVEHYHQYFKDVIFSYRSREEDNGEFERMHNFMVSSRSKFVHMLQSSDTAITAFKGFTVQTQALSEMMDGFVDFEKKFNQVTEAVSLKIEKVECEEDRLVENRLGVVPAFKRWAEVNDDMAGQYGKHLQTMIRWEIDDIEAFLETLAGRNAIASQYEKAKRKAAKWETHEPKNEQQKGQKEDDLAEVVRLRDLSQVVSALVALREFPRTRKERAYLYNRSVQDLAAAQIFSLRQLDGVWASVLHEDD